jgi:hypothetical protein
VTLTGWVRIATADDQRTTAITVIVGGTLSPEKDVVNRAFRVQHPTPQFFEYEGPATVEYSGKHLLIEGPDHVGWIFVVAGRSPATEVKGLPYPQFEVSGVSQFWGTVVHDTQEAVLVRLLTGGCARAAGGGNCDSCAFGGPGESSCSAECGDVGCEATCGAGSHACCSCPGSCACCPDIQAWHP